MALLLRSTLTRTVYPLLVATLLAALNACTQTPPENGAAIAAEATSAPPSKELSPQPEVPQPADQQPPVVEPTGSEPAGPTEGKATPASANVVQGAAAEVATAPPAKGENATEAEKPSARPSEDTLSSECRASLTEIREREKGVPMVFYGLSRPAEKIEQDVLRLIELCPKFLTECGGTQADGFVGATYARMLMSLDARYKAELEDQVKAGGLSADELRGKMSSRRSEVVAISEKAIDRSVPESPEWFTAHRMIQEAQLRLGQYLEVRNSSDIAFRDSAPYSVRTGAIEAITRSYMNEQRYDEAVKFLHRVIDKYSEDPEYVVYNIRLFEALNGAGDLLGMEELMHQVRAEYPARIERGYSEEPLAGAQKLLRSQYEQWYWCQSLFWLGYVHMALGDMEGAERFFEENIEEVASRSAQLQGEGKKIDNVCDIIVDYRTRHLLEFIQTKYSAVPEVDFDENLWATEKRPTLKEARESKKIVAIVMRRPDDPRSETFMTEIDRFVRKHADDGITGVWLSFLTGRSTPEDDQRAIQAMRTELEKLGVTMPSGYDSDRKAQNVVRELYGTVGTASFAVIDRHGRLAWWMADARDMDRNLAVRVLERLLAEK